MEHAEQRLKVVETARRLEADGLLVKPAGNVSARVGPHRIAITPTSMPYAEIEPSDVVLVDTESRGTDGERLPSSELPFHLAIYRRRSDVGAIVHTHSPYATVLATMRRPIPALHYAIALFGVDEIPVVPYETYGTEELAARVASAASGAGKGLLLANHGAVALGESLEEASMLAVLLEFLAAAFYRATVAGGPVILPPDEIQRVATRIEVHRTAVATSLTGEPQ